MRLLTTPRRPMNVLGVNAVFHDPAAALVVDGEIVAAAEEERFSRRKHGKPPVAFSTWELPEQAMAWCLDEAGLRPADLDAVAYSYDPASRCSPTATSRRPTGRACARSTRGARRCSSRPRCPGSTRRAVRFVPHHVAHAASATFASGFDPCSVLVLDGRGERARTSPAGSRAVRWRCSPRRRSRTRSACSTRS